MSPDVSVRSRRHRSGSRARRYQRGRRLESACAKTLASARGLCFYAPDVRRSHDGGLVSGLDPSLLRSRRPAPPARPLRLPARGPLFQKPYQAATVVKDRQWQFLTGRETYSRPTYAGRSSARPPAGVGAPTTWRRSSFPCTSLGALGPRIGSANGGGVHPRCSGGPYGSRFRRSSSPRMATAGRLGHAAAVARDDAIQPPIRR